MIPWTIRDHNPKTGELRHPFGLKCDECKRNVEVAIYFEGDDESAVICRNCVMDALVLIDNIDRIDVSEIQVAWNNWYWYKYRPSRRRRKGKTIHLEKYQSLTSWLLRAIKEGTS